MWKERSKHDNFKCSFCHCKFQAIIFVSKVCFFHHKKMFKKQITYDFHKRNYKYKMQWIFLNCFKLQLTLTKSSGVISHVNQSRVSVIRRPSLPPSSGDDVMGSLFQWWRQRQCVLSVGLLLHTDMADSQRIFYHF
jgi:hypothetical protein